MYLEYYKLKEKPFQITPDPKFLWLGEKHKEALATLRYGILDNRGFLLLTGEVGTGKTVMINRIVSLLDIDTVVATLPDPDLESMDFYNLLADGLKMDQTFDSKGGFLIHLRNFLHESYANKQQVLLIIDESQRLNPRLIEDIRVLSNIELHDRKLFNIFFVGQQEFNSIVTTPQNRALAQRITVRYHLEALDLQETGQYVVHRLMIAGCTSKIFNSAAIKKIYQFSGGIPRLINIISDHSMLTGYARDVRLLDENIIAECAEELRIPVDQPQSEVATIQSPVGVTATTGGDGRSLTAMSRNNPDGKSGAYSPAGNPGDESLAQQPLSWKLIYACVVLLLIGLLAFGITQFTGESTQRWDEDELTPQKYKSTLEKQKALLADQMKNNKDAANTKPAPKHVPDETKGVMARPPGRNQAGPRKQIEPLPLIDSKLLVQFKINSNEIDPDSYSVLDRIAAYLIANPDETLWVRGYTDTVGAESYNINVSRFRASAVKSYLVGKGVKSDKIEIFAMGSKNPIAPNNTLSGRKRNRRVEIEIPPKRPLPN